MSARHRPSHAATDRVHDSRGAGGRHLGPCAAKAGCDRVHRRAFEREDERPQRVVAIPGDERRLTNGQRAGLVEHQPAGSAQRLERVPTLDEDACSRCATNRRTHGERRRERQRAWAGRDQQRDGVVPRGGRVATQPEEEGRSRQRQDHQYEPRRQSVGQQHDRSAATRTLVDLRQNPGQSAIVA